MRVIRSTQVSRDRRKKQQRDAQKNLEREVTRDPVFKVNKLTGEKYYYGRLI